MQHPPYRFTRYSPRCPGLYLDRGRRVPQRETTRKQPNYRLCIVHATNHRRCSWFPASSRWCLRWTTYLLVCPPWICCGSELIIVSYLTGSYQSSFGKPTHPVYCIRLRWPDQSSLYPWLPPTSEDSQRKWSSRVWSGWEPVSEISPDHFSTNKIKLLDIDLELVQS